MIRRSAGLILVLLAAVSSGCADQNVKQMVAKPKPDATAVGGARRAQGRSVQGGGGCGRSADGGAVVVSLQRPGPVHGRRTERRVPDLQGTAFFQAVLTSRPATRAGRSLLCPRGLINWCSRARRSALRWLALSTSARRRCRSGDRLPSGFVVPADAGLIYIGTFNFACHEPTSRPDALKLGVHDPGDPRRGAGGTQDCADLSRPVWADPGSAGARLPKRSCPRTCLRIPARYA